MKPAVITVGRLNPPTRGHAVLVRRVLDIAKQTGSEPILFIVDGEKSGKDKNKNPLTGNQRESYVKQFFPGIRVDVVNSAYQVLEVLDVQGMTPAVWIAGTDRASNYRKLLASEKLEGEVVEVDREAGEADGVSATLARQAAIDGNVELFKAQMPNGIDDATLAEMMVLIREATNGGHSKADHSRSKRPIQSTE